jgi:hypothetical protein
MDEHARICNITPRQMARCSVNRRNQRISRNYRLGDVLHSLMVRVIIVVEDPTVTVKCRTVIQSLFPYLCLGLMLHTLACSSISFLIHLEVVASILPQINAGFCSFSVSSSHLPTKCCRLNKVCIRKSVLFLFIDNQMNCNKI